MTTEKSKTLSGIREEIERLGNTVEAMEMAAVQSAPKNYEALSMDAAMRGERLAVRLRDLVFSTTTEKRCQYLTKCADTMGIVPEYQEGIFKVTLPRQLPKRRWKNSEFLTRPLMAAMSELKDKTELPRFEEAAVCFVHIAERSLPTRLIRDHDNIESKQILDVLGAFLLTDDNGLLCETHHRTERGENSRTEVYVMAAEAFPEWITEREKAEKRGNKT